MPDRSASRPQRPGRNDPCPCGSGKKFKQCCMRKAAVSSSEDGQLLTSRPLEPTDEWKPGLLKRIPDEPAKTPVDKELAQAVLKRVADVTSNTYLMSRWTEQQVSEFKDLAQSVASSKVQQWQLCISEAKTFYLAMEIGQLKHQHGCSIYWNEVDQNLFCFRCEILNLLHDQVRRLFLCFDDHIALAMHARQMIEASLTACANQFVAFLCYRPLPRMMDEKGEVSFVEWEKLYQFASVGNGWSPKQRKALQRFLPQQAGGPKAELLTDEFEPTCQRLFAFTTHFAENWGDEDRSKSLQKEIADIQQCYRYLCKFAHVTPQAFRFPECSADELTNSEIQHSVQFCALDVMRLCFRVLSTLYLDPEYKDLRFQKVVDARIYHARRVERMFIKDSVLPAVFSNYHDVIVPSEDGVQVVHKVRRYSKEAEKLASRFDRLDPSEQASVLELVNSRKKGASEQIGQ